MENVFLLMWLADFVGSISFIGTIATMFFCIAVGIYAIAHGLDEVNKGGSAAMFFRTSKWLLIPMAIATVTPSKTTIQIIAASKATQVAASTQIGEKGLKAIESVLDKIVESNKKTK